MTTLDDKGFTDQEIWTTTGYRTIQNVQRYTRYLNDKRKRKMSGALQESMIESTSKNKKYPKQISVFGQQIEVIDRETTNELQWIIC